MALGGGRLRKRGPGPSPAVQPAQISKSLPTTRPASHLCIRPQGWQNGAARLWHQPPQRRQPDAHRADCLADEREARVPLWCQQACLWQHHYLPNTCHSLHEQHSTLLHEIMALHAGAPAIRHARTQEAEQGLSSHTLSSPHMFQHHKQRPTEHEGIFSWEEHANVCRAPVTTGYECGLQAIWLSHTSILRGSATLKLLSAPLRSSSPLSDSPRYITTCKLEAQAQAKCSTRQRAQVTWLGASHKHGKRSFARKMWLAFASGKVS